MNPQATNFVFWAVLIGAPFVGSFLAVVAMRLPERRGFLAGRSACDACGRVLGPAELIPVVSFVALRGRCRSCGAGIDPLHPVLEVAAFAVALSAALITSGWVLIASCVLGWMLLTLAAIDWRTGLLPDVLTYPLIVLGLVVAGWIDPGAAADHAIGAAGGFIVFALLTVIYRLVRRREGLGLGDAKLLAAAGAWLSWTALPSVVLFAAVIALGFVAVRRLQGQALAATDPIAFGPALALAIWLVWLFGPLVPG
jgi:leader peptidase (prepilin peptidase)/N-methyltransferase